MVKRPTYESVIRQEISWYSIAGAAPVHSARSWYPLVRTYSGTMTPNFRQRKLAKEFIPPLAYSSNVQRFSIPMSTLVSTYSAPPYQVDVSHDLHLANIGANTPPLNYYPDSVRSEVQNKALRRLYGRVQNVKANVALMFVERRQTAELISSTATRLAYAAVALKRADLRGFTRSLNLSARDTSAVARGWKRVANTPVDKRLANHWLEYVFGWTPLLSDIHDAAELLAESIATQKDPKGTVSSSARSTSSYVYRDPRTGYGHTYADIDSKASFTSRLKAWYELDSEARAVLSKTGISNPASLAWEALPFSFVIDWFLPVGNYLDSLTALDGFVFKHATTSMLENAVATHRLGVYNQPGYIAQSVFQGSYKAESSQSRYTRTLGIPGYSFPQLRSPIGGAPLKRFVTAVSLLVQKFRG